MLILLLRVMFFLGNRYAMDFLKKVGRDKRLSVPPAQIIQKMGITVPPSNYAYVQCTHLCIHVYICIQMTRFRFFLNQIKFGL